MNAGYERRLVSQQENVAREFTHLTVLSQAAARTSNSMELGKSKDEQLKELKKKKIEQRSGIYQMIPQKFHKYLDYLNSLKKSPTPAQIRQNLGLGAIFTFIVLTQSRKVMFYIIGTLGIMSSLLTRNMPQPKNLPGMPAGANRKVVNWSQSAFKTALAITMFYTLSSGLIAAGVVNLLNLPSKIRLIMATTLASSAYFTLFYEVFEEKSKPGWRWKQAMEGLLPEAMEKELKDQVFSKSSTKMQDEYDFEYDPQVDEYPRQPKYLDELDAEDTMTAGGSGELDENESKEHFDSWKQSRKEARRPAIEDVAPETPWVGGKAGLFVENAPKWLATAYQKNVLKANAWRGRPSKYVKDNSEFEAITGPVGFRDKRPEWLDLFGSGVWEEKVTASRRAARAFGTYRKTMYKLDDKVELQPCDGADK